jgi:tRNA(Ser,Leu) C12 N-acetylase TAN1
MATNGTQEFKSIMSDSDWQSVVNLLSVVEMVARYGPRYAEIASYALMDLDEIKKKIAEEMASIAKAKAEEELKAQVEAMKKAREAAA